MIVFFLNIKSDNSFFCKNYLYILFISKIPVAFAKPIDENVQLNDSIQVITKAKQLPVAESLINHQVLDNEFKQLKRERRSPGFWSFLCGRLKNCQ